MSIVDSPARIAKRWAKTTAKRLAPTARALVPENPLSKRLREMSLLQLSVKNLGYELGRTLARQRLSDARQPIVDPLRAGLGCKPTTQADIESPWLWYWCQQLRTEVIYHRKIWELAYVMQILSEHDMLVPGKRGIGFGCGQEPIPSLLAALGVDVTITDQASETARHHGWIETDQHMSSLDMAHHPDLVSREAFEARASVRVVDMNAIDPDIRGYDFCWSICAFEHLGSVAAGQAFVEESMKVLKPGGIAIHTTEFNLDGSGPTYETEALTLFQRKHLEEIAARLAAAGHHVGPLDFNAGNGPIDNFIDLPPYSFEAESHARGLSIEDEDDRVAHLKLSVGGYPTTCFGLWARHG